MTISDFVNDIRRHHRRRRFAMKLQQKVDRATKSFVRIHGHSFLPDNTIAFRCVECRHAFALTIETREKRLCFIWQWK